MSTRLVLTASAIVLGLAGLAATFAPDEILNALHASGAALPLLIQLLGALYVGFAMLNWTAQDSLIGGIYNRPLAIGNLVHFIVGALALVKGVMAGQRDVIIIAATVIYAMFALAFARIFFTSPVTDANLRAPSA
ncbi:MAG TPA: hypothetical protein VJZ00_18485 [Thermoanaerobaculia bacterium]|nr:hypothetical protein [Thermoanaerobaculia bacterium]